MGKRPRLEPSPLTATATAACGNAGDEDDGVSNSSGTEKSIISATGSNAGDEQHDGVSDSIDTEPSIITAAGDEHDDVSAVAALAADLRKFEIDSQVPEGLRKLVSSKELSFWFKEIAKAWTDNPPKTPKQASALVDKTVDRVSKSFVSLDDILAFSIHYGLPHYIRLSGEPEGTWIYEVRDVNSDEESPY